MTARRQLATWVAYAAVTAVIRGAMELPYYALVARVGNDYLFRVNP